MTALSVSIPELLHGLAVQVPELLDDENRANVYFEIIPEDISQNTDNFEWIGVTWGIRGGTDVNTFEARSPQLEFVETTISGRDSMKLREVDRKWAEVLQKEERARTIGSRTTGYEPEFQMFFIRRTTSFKIL